MAQKPGAGCGAVLARKAALTQAAARSKPIFMALLDCFATVCGLGAPATDDFSGSPCQDVSSDECNTCFRQSQNNCVVPLSAADMAMLTCAPILPGCPTTDTPCGTGVNAGLCGPQAGACILDCNSDQDCIDAGLDCGPTSGTTITCDVDGSLGGPPNICVCN